MKIAVCFSGQIRTGVYTAPNILNYIGSLLPNCDFFVHTWDVETDPHTANDFKLVDKSVFADFYRIYNPLDIVVEPYNTKPVSNDWGGFRVDEELGNVYALYETIYKANRLKTRFEEEYKFKYDYVVRIRTDLVFDRSKTLKDDLALITDSNMFVYGAHKCDFGMSRLEDIFWIAPSYLMDEICNFYRVRALSGVCGLPNTPTFVDTQIHIANWIRDGLGFRFRSLQNNHIKIFRRSDIGKDPIKDFENITPA
jgi:hypothetical protein